MFIGIDGETTIPVNIPLDCAAAGGSAFMQLVIPDGAAPAGVALSTKTEARFGF